MPETMQRRKGLKRKQLICLNRIKFPTRELAKEYITKQKNKGIRGSGTLHTFRCEICTNRQGEIFHVRQRRRGTK